MVILQLEHPDACKNIDEILAVPEISAILVGPYDLFTAMEKQQYSKNLTKSIQISLNLTL